MFLMSGHRRHFAGAFGSLRLLAMAGLAGIMMSTACVEVSSSPIDSPAVDARTDTSSAPSTAADAATSSTPASTPTTTTTTTTASGDALDLSRVTNFILPATPGVTADKVRSAKVTANIRAASTDGNTLWTSYDHYSFPSGNGVDAVCYFFYEYNGTVMGGKFDWWRTGGQGAKGLENVHGGYGGHKMPARGTNCWTMISSTDGKQRSNTCKVVWK